MYKNAVAILLVKSVTVTDTFGKMAHGRVNYRRTLDQRRGK